MMNALEYFNDIFMICFHSVIFILIFILLLCAVTWHARKNSFLYDTISK